MKRTALCLSLLLAALLCHASLAGEEPAAANPIEDIKMMRNLVAAEKALASQGTAAVSSVSEVLNENEVGPRVVAAKILARIATKVTSSELTQALDACFKDSNPGVRFWGFRGLTDPKQAHPDLAGILRRSLRPQDSNVMKMMAATLVGEHKVAAVTPEMMALLEVKVKEYEEALEKLLAGKIAGVTDVQKVVDDDAPMANATGASTASKSWMLPPGATSGSATRGTPSGKPGEEKKALLNPDELNLKAKKALIAILDDNDGIESLRTVGAAIEKATGQDWGFAKELPWKLRGPVDKAIGWSKKKGEGG